jgi:hypothetical protein
MEPVAVVALAAYLAYCVGDIFDSTRTIRQKKEEAPSFIQSTLLSIVFIAYLAIVIEYADEAIAITENVIGDLNIWKWAGLFVAVAVLGLIIRSIGVAILTASHVQR